jgi:hypothetical protein
MTWGQVLDNAYTTMTSLSSINDDDDDDDDEEEEEEEIAAVRNFASTTTLGITTEVQVTSVLLILAAPARAAK